MAAKNTIEDLLSDEIKDLYSAEKQLTKAIPKMAKGANSAELKAAFKAHLTETQGQVERLKRAAEILGISHGGKKCVGMEGLIEEGAELIEDADDSVRDAGLIGAAQRVEHYEIAGYGCVRTYATLLNRKADAKVLETTRKEEAATDLKLTELAAMTGS